VKSRQLQQVAFLSVATPVASIHGSTITHGEDGSVTVWVPSERINMVVGNNGETLKEIQLSTGCDLEVKEAPAGV